MRVERQNLGEFFSGALEIAGSHGYRQQDPWASVPGIRVTALGHFTDAAQGTP
jgi:hypothetical protein